MTLKRIFIAVCLVVIAGFGVTYFIQGDASPEAMVGGATGGQASVGQEPPVPSFPEKVGSAPQPENPPVSAVQAAPAPVEAPEPEAMILIEPDEDFVEVPLFFATNRQELAEPTGNSPADFFSSENGPLLYGFGTVTIPKIHEPGVLESQNWFSAILFEPNPEKHVILKEMSTDDKENVFNAVRAQLENEEDAILVYVHGFNTSLEKGMRRAGQLTYDLSWHGPSFLFSWPSQAVGFDYFVDSTLAERSYARMEEFLKDLTDQEPKKIVVIAHSMGTRVLSHGLARLAASDPDAANKITSVILAAPDIDEQVFKEDLAPIFQGLSGPDFTLYASSADSALTISKGANGFRRIGDTTDGVPEIEGFDVLDATQTESNFFEHTYFAESTSILSDVYLKVQKCWKLEDRITVTQVAETEGESTASFWQVLPGVKIKPEEIVSKCETP